MKTIIQTKYKKSRLLNKKQQPLPEEVLHPVKENTGMMVQCAWLFAKECLWADEPLPAVEEANAKRQISSLLLQEADPYRAYLEFCQRIILSATWPEARAIIPRCSPARWLDAANATGYAETLAPYRQLLEKRRTEPLYKQSWKALAEAILDIGEDHSRKNIDHWNNWFRDPDPDLEPALFNSCSKDIIPALLKQQL